MSAHALEAGDRCITTFWSTGDITFVDQAIALYRTAITDIGSVSEERIHAQLSLADALRIQFEEGVGNDEQYREALSLAETALAECDPSSQFYLHALRVLGLVLCRKFHPRDPANIHRATDIFSQLVVLSANFGPDAQVEALALQSSTAAFVWDDLEDPSCSEPANVAVDRAVSLLNGRPIYEFPVLAIALSDARFIRNIIGPNEQDAEEAIQTLADLIQHTPSGHPRLFDYWNCLAVYYAWTNWHGGDPDYLDRSTESYDNARRLVHTEHPYWHVIHGNYAEMLYTRFLVKGRLEDLEEATNITRAVVKHIHQASPESSAGADIYVRILGNILQTSYANVGKLELLDEAIVLHAESLESSPPARRRYALGALGRSYLARFRTHKRPSDIDSAIGLLAEALDGAPMDYDHEQASRNLAEALLARYDHNGESGDLGQAISVLRTALGSDYPKPEYRAHNHSLLGYLLLGRANATENAHNPMDDIRESVRYQNLALQAFPRENPMHVITVSRLGLAEFEAFGRGQDHSALKRSIESFLMAVAQIPQYHPDKAKHLLNLGRALTAQVDMEGKGDIRKVLRAFEQGATASGAWIQDRYDAAVEWAAAAHGRNHIAEALEAYRMAISFLPQLAWLGLESELRISHLARQASGLSQDAAACAIELGQYAVAIELMESSRSVVWNTGQELRADVGRLKDEWPELSQEVSETTSALEFRSPDEGRSQSNNEREAERRRLHRLATRWTELISLIRQKPGFQQFLTPPSFDALCIAAKDGPVVILNASSYRCDALILAGDGHVSLVPLHGAKHHELEKESSVLQSALRVTKDARGLQFLESFLHILLRRLWGTTGRPVWQALWKSFNSSATLNRKRRLPRVWWCPTGNFSFLPIHACGPYDGRQTNMPDLAISSYTPTVSALARAQNSVVSSTMGLCKPLVICQPELNGRPPLPCALVEMAVLQAVCPEGTFLVGPTGTVSRVISLLPSHGWLHVASHGTQNGLNPLESAIQLYDGPLKLSAIAQIRLPEAQFAFLSACHSAKGAEWLPDESMHLAAGLIFAGYKSVVATSWGIADQDAPRVTSLFYGYLGREGNGPVLSDSAEGLHMACKALREIGLPLVRWVPFIHMGL